MVQGLLFMDRVSFQCGFHQHFFRVKLSSVFSFGYEPHGAASSCEANRAFQSSNQAQSGHRVALFLIYVEQLQQQVAIFVLLMFEFKQEQQLLTACDCLPTGVSRSRNQLPEVPSTAANVPAGISDVMCIDFQESDPKNHGAIPWGDPGIGPNPFTRPLNMTPRQGIN